MDYSFSNYKQNMANPNKVQDAVNQIPGDAQADIPLPGQPMSYFDKGGRLPKISLHDGNHKLVVAEAGERILTPEQNHEYEAQHPDARVNPMMAKVYDGGGVVGGSEISEATPLGKSIANRTQELYAQAKDGGQSIMDPKDPGSAGRRRETNAVLNAVSSRNEGDPAAPYEPSANDRVHPLGQAYGSRPGEKRIYTDPEGNAVNPTTPQGLGAVGPKAPIPTALGKLPMYDDGGTVQTEEAPGQAQLDDEKLKVAAHQQAIDEHEQALGDVPLSHGQPQAREAAQDSVMHRYPAPQKPARLQYDTEKPVDESKGVAELGGDARMNTDNAPLSKPVMNNQNAAPWEVNPVQEISAKKTPLGPQVAPQGTEMSQLPGQAALDKDQVKPEEEPVAPDLMKIVQADKLAAMQKGPAGLTDLGTSLIHEKALMPKYTRAEGEDKKALEEKSKENYQQTVDTLRDKMINGATEQERFQAEKDLAEFKRRNPWGSEGNHPGILGKIGHVAAGLGQAAAMGVAPYMLPSIPGSQAQLAQQEARGEQGVEQAQKKEQQTAITKEAEQQPALREEAQKLTAQKNENTLRAAGYKTDPTTGERVPLTYDEMSPQQQAVADKNESIQTLNEAKGHEQEAKAILEKYKADPNNAQNQAALQKLQLEGKKIAISAGNLGLHEKEFLRDTYGVDEKGEPIPGVQTTPEGKPVGTKISAASAKGTGKVTANQSMKADLAENVVHNVDEATKLIRENPGLFGKVSGRFTTAAQMIGSNDPAIAKLGLIIHNTALATNGIHGLRSAQAIEGTEKELLNKFKNSPEATIAALKENRRSVEDFMKDGGKKLVPDPDLIPAGASHEVLDKAGNVTGHVVNNKYVALPKE